MTAFGKLLVFVNLFVSLGLLSWTVSAYSNRLDWVDRKTEDGVIKGQITTLQEEITKVSKAIADSQAAYGQRSIALGQVEANRDYRKFRFQQRLAKARVGNDPTGPFRVQLPQAANLPGGEAFTNLEQEGPVINGPDARPLRGLDALRLDFAKQSSDARRINKGDVEVTPAQWTQIAGGDTATLDAMIPMMGLNDLRKLHGVLSDLVSLTEVSVGKQKDILVNLREEASFLGDKRVSWEVQLQSLERRQRQLEARLKQLGG